MRIVIVGAGMVGHRLADELVRAAGAGASRAAGIGAGEDLHVILLGDEAHEPYNRVMLSELLAGRIDLAGIELPRLDPDRVRVRLDAPVRAIDPARREVVTDTDRIGYDHLVLCTGARPRIPHVPGLRDGLPGGAYAVRRVDDVRDISAAALNARHAIVVGAGPLGVEVACALRHRGTAVSLLAPESAMLNRDLDEPVGEIVARTAGDLGIGFVSDAELVAVEADGGHVTAVRLADGRRVDCDLLVLACGAIPDTDLAARAGLPTDRGIVVDAQLRTGDPHVSAIGDCAQTPDGVSGLIAPGWAQARALARRLLRGEPVGPIPIEGATMRLKAVGMSVVTMGVRASTARDADRVLVLDDRRARRHVEVVVRAGTLVGLTCVGAPEMAARLASQYDRPGIVPPDPLALLLADAPREANPSPTTMPSSTTVCRCNGVTKGDLVHAWSDGCTSVDALVADTRATSGCGGCRELVCGIARWLERSDPPLTASRLAA
ncbi:FAD-dependent oxidoreductase [Polymorphospora sp. NPDC050346]|uniref:FAD-dependent oxidoreductase n=1 Tax=Polymorphospora sp. NPDC050346 TaxID=3155780 RepID=UPI0033C00DF3